MEAIGDVRVLAARMTFLSGTLGLAILVLPDSEIQAEAASSFTEF
jgi:hypothetical protein